MSRSISVSNRWLAVAALLLPSIAFVFLTYALPGEVSSTTYAVIWVLALGTSIIVMNTWRNAQPARSLRQAAFDAGDTDSDRGRSTTRLRVLSLLSLSVGVTAIIVGVWLR